MTVRCVVERKVLDIFLVLPNGVRMAAHMDARHGLVGVLPRPRCDLLYYLDNTTATKSSVDDVCASNPVRGDP